MVTGFQPKLGVSNYLNNEEIFHGLIWLPFLGQFSTMKNQNYVQQSKKQLSFRI
jgi:hypothetical protein